MPRSVKQEVVLNATPVEVYNALMDSRKHGAFTGAPAKISKKVGGVVSCYGGGIQAINVELVAGKRIIQSWRGSQWKPGEWSLAIFNLKKRGKKTTLSLEQYGVPDHDVAMVRKGWKDYYWIKMNDYFDRRR
jgi:activator of HSP90 ATPase